VSPIPLVFGDQARHVADLIRQFRERDAARVEGAVYDSRGAHGEDPLCCPSRASDAELHGLPPHVISVNELDPLRDEGIAYQRRLVANGVSSLGRTVNGTVHGAEVFFPGAIPDISAATIRDIHAFATAATQ
jgi:acetyl esterase